MNPLLEESDSDSTGPDEQPPNRIESRAEIHPNPRNEGSTRATSTTGDLLTLTAGITDLPTTASTDTTVECFLPAAGSRSAEADNEGFGFDEEYFGENRAGGATSEHSSDPLQVEIHGKKNPAGGKNSNA